MANRVCQQLWPSTVMYSIWMTMHQYSIRWAIQMKFSKTLRSEQRSLRSVQQILIPVSSSRYIKFHQEKKNPISLQNPLFIFNFYNCFKYTIDRKTYNKWLIKLCQKIDGNQRKISVKKKQLYPILIGRKKKCFKWYITKYKIAHVQRSVYVNHFFVC